MLLERVRRALAPEYDVLQEIAGGGMGVVFAARQRRLDRRVAVKILRPEQATAIAAERFLAEGRLLARLAHPNIVPVYDAGEADGLLYYAMEFIEGETLADRLARGPLPAAEALRLGQDLLAALSAAHALGVVHRDVKPANIFLRDGRALLGDFGIARWREEHEQAFTTPGELIGTPRYMSPEQRDGLPSTARTDVYAAGLVLWESCSGSRWPFYQAPEQADWSRLPPELAVPVRKALELDPEGRWADAREFASGLGRPRRRRPALWAFGALLAVVVAGLAGRRLFRPDPVPPARAGLTIAVERFDGVPPPLGDSLAEAIRARLRGLPDFTVLAAGPAAADSLALRLGGTVELSDGHLGITLQDLRAARSQGAPLAVHRRDASAAQWHLAVDAIAAELVQEIWRREDQFLPVDALPESSEGRLLFFQAEQLWSFARWEEADAAYAAAERRDTTCALCSFRLLDIARWLGTPRDTLRLLRLEREQHRFSPVYQTLIHAMGTPLPARLDTLAEAAKRWDKFFLAAFHYGDELLHRGALYGRLRSDAGEPLNRTVQLAPHFDPGWEHLAFFQILQGDSARTATALAALRGARAGSRFSEAFRTLLFLGYLWRFLDPAVAREQTLAALTAPSVSSNPEATGGARLLLMLDAPRGAVELGGMFARTGDPALVSGGLLGQLTGYAALGWLDSLRATGERLRRHGDDATALLALELEVVLRCFDPEPSGCADATLREALLSRLDDSPLGRRAAWALGVLAVRARDSALLGTVRLSLRQGAAPDSYLEILDSAARGAAPPRLQPLESEQEYDDPLQDAVVRLLRSESLLTVNPARARDSLRWHEHVQLTGHLNQEPQAGELAWALGTLVRWKRSQLLETFDRGTVEHCNTYQAVARVWRGAPAPYGARADSARRALRRLGCATAP